MKCNIDPKQHVWHDLRHTYATVLNQNDMNMKVVSKILGHYSETFTEEDYVIHKREEIIYDLREPTEKYIQTLGKNFLKRKFQYLMSIAQKTSYYNNVSFKLIDIKTSVKEITLSL